MATDTGAAELDEFGDELPNDEPPEALSAEQRARIRGWKPLEEYTGPPGRWRDAEEFLRIGDGDARILREENRRLGTKVHRLEGQITALVKSGEEQLTALREMRQIAARNDQRGYDRAKQELDRDKAAAVAAADPDAFAQVEAQIAALGDRPADAPPAPPPPLAQAAADPAVTEFIEDNPWYVNDQLLNRTMIAFYDIVARANPTWSIADNLEEAKARTVAEHPEKFPDMATPPRPAPQRRPAAPVARPGAPPSRQPRSAAGWEQIDDPQERQQAKDSFASQKRGDPQLTEREFLTIYLDPHVDVLALRAQRPKP